MTRILVSLVLATVVFVAPAEAAPIDDLAWLSGCWSLGGESRRVDEQWTAPAGGTLLGVNRNIREGRTVAHEFLIIRADAAGLVYVAQPSGQKPTEFRAVRQEARSIVFENPEHDFPQRIAYLLDDSGILHARAEALDPDQGPGLHFPFQRVDCP